MQTTKIAAKNQEITIYLYWQMLRELEGKAGDNILTKHLVEASYRHWNTITGDDQYPFWVQKGKPYDQMCP